MGPRASDRPDPEQAAGMVEINDVDARRLLANQRQWI